MTEPKYHRGIFEAMVGAEGGVAVIPGPDGAPVGLHMGTKDSDERAQAIIDARREFCMQYAKEKGWLGRLNDLTIEQVMEIRAQIDTGDFTEAMILKPQRLMTPSDMAEHLKAMQDWVPVQCTVEAIVVKIWHRKRWHQRLFERLGWWCLSIGRELVIRREQEASDVGVR